MIFVTIVLTAVQAEINAPAESFNSPKTTMQSCEKLTDQYDTSVGQRVPYRNLTHDLPDNITYAVIVKKSSLVSFHLENVI